MKSSTFDLGLRLVSIFKVGLIFLHVGNLQITYAGMSELGWQGPLPREEGTGETEGPP